MLNELLINSYIYYQVCIAMYVYKTYTLRTILFFLIYLSYIYIYLCSNFYCEKPFNFQNEHNAYIYIYILYKIHRYIKINLYYHHQIAYSIQKRKKKYQQKKANRKNMKSYKISSFICFIVLSPEKKRLPTAFYMYIFS